MQKIVLALIAASVLIVGVLGISAARSHGAEASAPSCEYTIDMARASAAADASITLAEITKPEDVSKLVAAFVFKMGPPPFETADVTLVLRVVFEGAPMVNVGFFDKNGCILGIIAGLPRSRYNAIEALAFGNPV